MKKSYSLCKIPWPSFPRGSGPLWSSSYQGPQGSCAADPSVAFFETQISDVTPGICWSHLSNLGLMYVTMSPLPTSHSLKQLVSGGHRSDVTIDLSCLILIVVQTLTRPFFAKCTASGCWTWSRSSHISYISSHIGLDSR